MSSYITICIQLGRAELQCRKFGSCLIFQFILAPQSFTRLTFSMQQNNTGVVERFVINSLFKFSLLFLYVAVWSTVSMVITIVTCQWRLLWQNFHFPSPLSNLFSLNLTLLARLLVSVCGKVRKYMIRDGQQPAQRVKWSVLSVCCQSSVCPQISFQWMI